MVLIPSTFYYPYTGKVHIHLMDLDEPVRVNLHLASSHDVPNITLEVQGSDILQLNWPNFSNVSHGPMAGLRTWGRGVHPLPTTRAALGELSGDMGSILDGQQVIWRVEGHGVSTETSWAVSASCSHQHQSPGAFMGQWGGDD